MNNELYHFGIKGQKWGVRRFQNSDGTLTPVGKKQREKMKRTNDASAKISKQVVDAVNSGDIKRAKTELNSLDILTRSRKEIAKNVVKDLVSGASAVALTKVVSDFGQSITEGNDVANGIIRNIGNLSMALLGGASVGVAIGNAAGQKVLRDKYSPNIK